MSFWSTFFSTRWRDSTGHLEDYSRRSLKKLEQLLSTARANIPWQRQRIPASLDFSQIPPVEKVEMMNAFPDTVDPVYAQKLDSDLQSIIAFMQDVDSQSSPWINEKILLNRTGGTTGEPAKFLSTTEEMAAERAISLARKGFPKRHIRKFIKHRPYRLAAGFIDNKWSSSKSLVEDSQRKHSGFIEIAPFSIVDPPDQTYHFIQEFRPHEVAAYPGYLRLIAEQVLAHGPLQHCPEVIASGGDLLTDEDRLLIREAFPGALIANHYGSVECSPIALSCERGSLHINSDFVIVEPVDKHDHPMPLDEWSDNVLVTSLLKFLHPVIRYRQHDSIRIRSGACPCGLKLPVMEIRGRRFPPMPVTDDADQVKLVDPMPLIVSLQIGKNRPKFRIEYHELDKMKIILMPAVAGRQDGEQFLQRHQHQTLKILNEWASEMSIGKRMKFKISAQSANKGNDGYRKRKRLSMTVTSPSSIQN